MTLQAGEAPPTLTIEAETDAAGAPALRETLLAQIAATGPWRVEIAGESPTAPALQLAAAARRSLETRGDFAGFGPVAARLLTPSADKVI